MQDTQVEQRQKLRNTKLNISSRRILQCEFFLSLDDKRKVIAGGKKSCFGRLEEVGDRRNMAMPSGLRGWPVQRQEQDSKPRPTEKSDGTRIMKPES